jgi:hypothetical protein
VSKQLGHSDLKVTIDHYAKWCGGDEYRDPLSVLPGEVPADVIARIEAGETNPMSDPTPAFAEAPARAVNERTPRKANGRPAVTPDRPSREMVELRGIEPLTLRLPACKFKGLRHLGPCRTA